MVEQHSGAEILDFRPISRQTVVITEKAIETKGEVSRIEVEVDGRQIGPPAHVHPAQGERYEVSEGVLTVKLDGKKHRVGTGEAIEVPVGATHTFSNDSDEIVRFSAEHYPALRFEEYIRKIHAELIAKGKSRVDPLTIMRVIRIESSFGETIMAPPGFPRLMAKTMSGIGGLLGYPTGDQIDLA